eukprot:3260020-Rhodomonas_salina.2
MLGRQLASVPSRCPRASYASATKCPVLTQAVPLPGRRAYVRSAPHQRRIALPQGQIKPTKPHSWYKLYRRRRCLHLIPAGALLDVRAHQGCFKMRCLILRCAMLLPSPQTEPPKVARPISLRVRGY